MTVNSIVVTSPCARTMMYVSRLVLLLGLLLCLGVQLSTAQHWSHGWYPGGKRELEAFTTSEVGMDE